MYMYIIKLQMYMYIMNLCTYIMYNNNNYCKLLLLYMYSFYSFMVDCIFFSIMDPTLPKSAVSFSKSFHGGPTATTFNNTTLYGPTKHYVGFEGLGKGLHSTPRVTGHHGHSKHHLRYMYYTTNLCIHSVYNL